MLSKSNKKNLFKKNNKNEIIREKFIKSLLNTIKRNSKVISTTGFTSRELDQVRKNYKLNNGKDFYMIGGMGHSSSVALGVSLKFKGQVICLDGDGSLLMHMGSLTDVGKYANRNYKHILLNNFSHESVGGQKTNIDNVNTKNLIRAVGYKKYFIIKNKNQIKKTLNKFLKSNGPVFLEVITKEISMKNLKRPNDFLKIKKMFMK